MIALLSGEKEYYTFDRKRMIAEIDSTKKLCYFAPLALGGGK